MEIVKLNESYNVTDKFENFSVSGTLYKESNNNLNLSLDIYTGLEEHIGNFNYSKINETECNFYVSIKEDERVNFTKHVDSIIESVLSYFD